jgi:imidazolonepropionase-like amidohydrolase
MTSRIYVASDSAGKSERLVRASHPGHALRHVFKVRVATQSDLERLISRGAKVENATDAPTIDLEHEAMQAPLA